MTQEISKPTDQLTVSTIDGKVIKDSLGREIVLRKPNLLDQIDFMDGLDKRAEKPMILSLAMSLLFIAKFDGMVFQTPLNWSECRAAFKRLGDEGLAAVRDAINDTSISDPAKEKEQIKK